MRYRDILCPVICAACGFAAGWFAHKKIQQDNTDAKLREQAERYKETINDIRAKAKAEGAEEEKVRAVEEQVEKDHHMYGSLKPGFYTAEEYNRMFKPASPVTTMNDDGKEEGTRVNINGQNGPSYDDDSDDEDYASTEPDDDIIDLSHDEPIIYIRPQEVGVDHPSYQEVDLKVFKDGIVTDDIWNIIPFDEANDMLGVGFMDHMGEFEDEAFWCMNRRNHTYYEVLLDPRTYREATGRKG